MARLRILRAVAGLDFSWKRGDLVDLDDEQAARWADGIRAELIGQDPPPAPQAPAAAAAGAPAADQAEGPGSDSDSDGQDEKGPGADLFDPSSHPVKEVLAYLDGVGEEEAMRVLQLEESADQPRRGIVGQRGSILERAQAHDSRTIERAAETSRGGGRGAATETR